MNDNRVKNLIKNGSKNVADVFIDNDIPMYKENKIFLEIAKFLNEYSINK